MLSGALVSIVVCSYVPFLLHRQLAVVAGQHRAALAAPTATYRTRARYRLAQGLAVVVAAGMAIYVLSWLWLYAARIGVCGGDLWPT